LETERALSFMDIQPRSLGHCLVIPKVHAVRLAELDDATVAEVFGMARDVVAAMQKALGPDAFTVGINDGEAAGQVVLHLHVNVIPRFRGDGGKAIHSVVSAPPAESIGETAERIRAALNMP
jgi:histidine triad (HIT) family protein